MYFWCQTPEGVVSPRRVITRAQCEWSPHGETTPGRLSEWNRTAPDRRYLLPMATTKLIMRCVKKMNFRYTLSFPMKMASYTQSWYIRASAGQHVFRWDRLLDEGLALVQAGVLSYPDDVTWLWITGNSLWHRDYPRHAVDWYRPHLQGKYIFYELINIFFKLKIFYFNFYIILYAQLVNTSPYSYFTLNILNRVCVQQQEFPEGNFLSKQGDFLSKQGFRQL